MEEDWFRLTVLEVQFWLVDSVARWICDEESHHGLQYFTEASREIRAKQSPTIFMKLMLLLISPFKDTLLACSAVG